MVTTEMVVKSNYFCYILHRSKLYDLSKIPFCVRTVGCRFDGPEYKSLFVSHHFYEINWTISGQGIFHTENDHYILKPGHLIIIPEHLKRQYCSYQSEWHYRWFTVTGSYFNELLNHYNFQQSVPFFVGNCPETDFIQLENEIKEMSYYSLQMANATAFRILIKALSGKNAGIHESKLINHSIALIEKHLEFPDLNVDWLAEMLNCHRSFLSRTFRQEMGLPPSSYIAQKRLQHAIVLLSSQQNISIQAISQKCGFRNPDYFSRFFRKHTGKRPSDFRKEEIR